MAKVTVNQGDTIQVLDDNGKPFEGQIQVPSLDNKNHTKMSQTVVRVKPEVLERRDLAEYFAVETTNADMEAIHVLINPLYNALRAISQQVNIDRDAKAEEEVYKFINAMRANLDTLFENKP